MDTHSKYYWAVVGVAALAVLGIIFVLNDYLSRDAAIDSAQIKKTEINARLLIDFGNGRKRAFRGEVVEGMTVYDALVASREVGGFSFSFRGDVIDEIGGTKNNAHVWRSYVNGKPTAALPQFEEVKPGDEIVFKFE